ncbi:MAG TPA: DUF892 family protein [Anaerolineales bacterium]|nr:DUF892 family protein [Anaerolineales bacterium]
MAAELELLRYRYLQKLNDLYGGEKEMLEMLPEAVDRALSLPLKSALQYLLEKTQGHVQRLEQVFAEMGRKPANFKRPAIATLIPEGRHWLETDEWAAEADIWLISAARKFERCEISGYLAALNYAQILRDHAAADLLEQTLNEEYEADRILAGLTEVARAAEEMEEASA